MSYRSRERWSFHTLRPPGDLGREDTETSRAARGDGPEGGETDSPQRYSIERGASVRLPPSYLIYTTIHAPHVTQTSTP